MGLRGRHSKTSTQGLDDVIKKNRWNKLNIFFSCFLFVFFFLEGDNHHATHTYYTLSMQSAPLMSVFILVQFCSFFSFPWAHKTHKRTFRCRPRLSVQKKKNWNVLKKKENSGRINWATQQQVRSSIELENVRDSVEPILCFFVYNQNAVGCCCDSNSERSNEEDSLLRARSTAELRFSFAFLSEKKLFFFSFFWRLGDHENFVFRVRGKSSAERVDAHQ